MSLAGSLLPAVVVALAAGCGGAAVASHPAPPAETVGSGAALQALPVAEGFDRPVYLTAAPGETERLYVVEQAGTVLVLEDGKPLAEPFLDVSALIRTSAKGELASEQGLLSLAFAPDYRTSGRLYIAYTDTQDRVTVAEYHARDGRVDGGSARLLLQVEKTQPSHNGGQLQFGPDGDLYVGLGDDADARLHPQSLEPDDRLGKILRLDLGAPGGEWEVVAYGLRNPWRFSFDRGTGDLWIGDVGNLAWEEVNRIPRSRPGLRNLGWPSYEGHEAVVPREGRWSEPDGTGELVWPVAVYSRGEGCAAVIGGYVYRGEDVSAASGRYLYGDFCSGRVWSLDPADPRRVRHELDLGTTLASFGEDGAGELYLVSRTGSIFRLAE